ncbi:MAG: DNA mismatch repair protein MutL, partial [Veillonella sp.]|nr:DNA mismatch repair protein MutL [Veillonella sp.]
RRTKGYEVMRGETTQFVESLKTKGFTPPPPKATYEQSSFTDESFDAVPTEYTSYTKEDVDKFKSLAQDIRKENTEARTIQNSGFLPMGQVASCYILAKKGDDLYIIDQHAAHERVRYDKLCKSSESIPMQSILVPQYSEATDDEMNLVEEERETLLDLGFDVELGGPTKIKLVGAPVDLVESKAFEILQYVFSYLHEHQQPTKAQLRHEMLAYASCRGAIKAGHNLNMYQMTTLIEDLFSTEKPYVCPHGRPTIIKFTPDELGKLFLRS